MSTKTKAPARLARGFTLVELMVAMAIGLILTVVVAQIFLGSKATFNSTDNLSRLQENARYALTLMSREIRSSGFKSDPRALASVVFPPTAQALTGVDGGGTASDTLTVRFQGSGNGTGTPDQTVQNCVGTGVDYNATVVTLFFIQPDPTNNNEPTLYCNFIAAPTAANCVTTGVAPTCFALIPGVENMQILYGEDTTAPPADQAVDRWVTANNVSNWDNVLGVRISLLLRTGIGVNTGTDTKTYTMAGANVAAPGNDTRMRRVYTTVVNLRNRTP
jgi:type IV pilus assembly protein PilW